MGFPRTITSWLRPTPKPKTLTVPKPRPTPMPVCETCVFPCEKKSQCSSVNECYEHYHSVATRHRQIACEKVRNFTANEIDKTFCEEVMKPCMDVWPACIAKLLETGQLSKGKSVLSQGWKRGSQA